MRFISFLCLISLASVTIADGVKKHSNYQVKVANNDLLPSENDVNLYDNTTNQDSFQTNICPQNIRKTSTKFMINANQDDGYDPLIIEDNIGKSGNSLEKSKLAERSFLIGFYYEGSIATELNFNSIMKLPYTSNVLLFIGYEIKTPDIYMSIIMPFKLLTRQPIGINSSMIEKQLSLEYHVGPCFFYMFALNLIGGITFTSIDFQQKNIKGLGGVLGAEALFSFSIFSIFAGFKWYFGKVNQDDKILFAGLSFGI